MTHDPVYIELTVQPEQVGKGRATSVYVTSKDVPGLHLIGRCLNDMRPVVEKAIKRLYRDNLKTAIRQVIWLSPAQPQARAEKTPSHRLAVLFKQPA